MKKMGLIATSLVLASGSAAALPIGGSFSVSASFSPNVVAVGNSTTFNWNSPIGAYCEVEGLPGGTRVGRTGAYTFAATSNVTVYVSCERADSFAGKSASLTVTGPVTPTVSSGFSPSTVYPNNANNMNGSTYSWYSTNATACTSSLLGSMATSGSIWIASAPSPSQLSLTMTCNNANASASSTAVLTTIAEPVGGLPPTVNVTASPSYISRAGGYTTISYTATNYTSCTGAGRYRVFDSTDFEVSCTGPGGTTTGYAWVEVAGSGQNPNFASASSASLDGQPVAAKRGGVADLKALGIDLSKKRYAHAESDFNKDGVRDILVYDKLTSRLHVVMGKDGKFPAISRTIENVHAISQVKAVTVPASNVGAEIRVTLETQQ
jgi:hypothetical protein